MTLLMLEIPDSHDELPVWLERQILGSRLGELIEQLSVIHAEAGGAGGSIEETLGSRLPEVLSRGLAVLPPAALSQLLTRPLLLLELQELVMSRGGSYWDDWEPKLVSDESITERGRERLKNFLGTERWLDQDRREPAERRRWKIRSLAINLASVAAAAGVVIGFWINRSPQAAPTASVDQPIGQLASAQPANHWGWTKPDALLPNLPRNAYLEHLAATADEWFQARPADAVALATRLHEFRAGCSVLILSRHDSLPPGDQYWLRDKCREWAVKLDDHLARLEAGKDAAAVLRDADKTVTSLIKGLRRKAEEPATKDVQTGSVSSQPSVQVAQLTRCRPGVVFVVPTPIDA